MYYIPFIFASIYSFIIYRKNGVDLAFFVSIIYTMSTFLSIVLATSKNGTYLEDYGRFDITLIPTFLFCACNYYSVRVAALFNTNRRRHVDFRIKDKAVSYIILVYLIAAFLMLFLFGNQLPQRLAMDSMNELRELDGMREVTIMDGLSFIEKLFGYAAIAICSGGYFLIVFFYFGLAFGALSKRKCFLLLFLSTLPILIGILNTDRSNSFYWILLVCMGYFIFKPYLNQEKKKYLLKTVGVFFVFVGLYFAAVSIARFSESDWGAKNSLIDYIGQPYLIFCNEWNHLVIKGFSLKDIFPFMKLVPWYNPYHQIINNADFSANGFPTYAGTLMRTMGHFWAVIIPFSVFIISKRFIYRIKVLNLNKFVTLFVILIIPQTGIISYFFNNEFRFLDAFLFIYLTKKICKIQ